MVAAASSRSTIGKMLSRSLAGMSNFASSLSKNASSLGSRSSSDTTIPAMRRQMFLRISLSTVVPPPTLQRTSPSGTSGMFVGHETRGSDRGVRGSRMRSGAHIHAGAGGADGTGGDDERRRRRAPNERGGGDGGKGF